MGTRHLIMIRLDGVLKLANYGQWDGYPTGQGVTVAAFVQAYLRNKTLRAEFADGARALKFGTPSELNEIQAEWEAVESDHKKAAKKGNYVPKYQLAKFDAFSRDTGATILAKINEGLGLQIVKDDSEFLKDGLFCEWAYCVDLDACTVEVYKGDVTPAAVIPFAKFTVISMRKLEKTL